MPIKKSRQTLDKQEIIDLLQTNADLFKNEPDFGSYIADLAIYLLENHYAHIIEQRRESDHPTPMPSATPIGRIPSQRDDRPAIPEELTSTEVSNFARRYKVLKDISRTHKIDNKERMCPNCGQKAVGVTRCPRDRKSVV